MTIKELTTQLAMLALSMDMGEETEVTIFDVYDGGLQVYDSFIQLTTVEHPCSDCQGFHKKVVLYCPGPDDPRREDLREEERVAHARHLQIVPVARDDSEE